LQQVDWGELNYLVVDLPPGTGDAQLTITQSAPLTGGIIVTTPQDVSLIDARKGLLMFQQVRVPVLGIVENMSYFVCDGCGKRHEIFRYGGGRRTSEELGVPFLGEVPLDPKVTLGGDQGEPVVISAPDSPASEALRGLAAKVVAQSEAAASMQPSMPTVELTGLS
jgi:ATP-binding protein involved in chromosome partitioning